MWALTIWIWTQLHHLLAVWSQASFFRTLWWRLWSAAPSPFKTEALSPELLAVLVIDGSQLRFSPGLALRGRKSPCSGSHVPSPHFSYLPPLRVEEAHKGLTLLLHSRTVLKGHWSSLWDQLGSPLLQHCISTPLRPFHESSPPCRYCSWELSSINLHTHPSQPNLWRWIVMPGDRLGIDFRMGSWRWIVV